MSFYSQIVAFLAQARTNDLKTLRYPKVYSGLKVKVSFGQGQPARVPWIALLGENNTVRKGIYPAYLYFKDKNLLILALGVSEYTPAANRWGAHGQVEIGEYFVRNNLGTPARYANSSMYKDYDTSRPLNEDSINKDLEELIRIYKSVTTMAN